MQPNEPSDTASDNSWQSGNVSKPVKTATLAAADNNPISEFQKQSEESVSPSLFSPVAPPQPPENTLVQTNETSDKPVPVVKVLSVRGLEYLFMSIFLWLSAGSFIGLVLSLLNGQTGFSTLAFPLSMLLVCLPGFALLFLRLKKAEMLDPSLRFDASKRRLTQITQVLAFLTCLINIITFMYLVLQKIGGEGELAFGKVLINVGVILVVAGGILVYYWNDEHRRVK